MKQKILLIEDDDDIAGLLVHHFKKEGFDILRCDDGPSGLVQAMKGTFDLLIVDVMLPGMSGLALCTQFRKEGLQTPIIMLTAKSEESEVISGLETGADDYITKPFRINELLARAKAHLRRAEMQWRKSAEEFEGPLIFRDLKIDPRKREAYLFGKRIDFTPIEFDLLYFLAKNAGAAFSRQDLLTLVWDYDFSGYELTVNSHISRLRSKIEGTPAVPEYILTVRGVGYRFAEPHELLPG